MAAKAHWNGCMQEMCRSLHLNALPYSHLRVYSPMGWVAIGKQKLLAGKPILHRIVVLSAKTSDNIKPQKWEDSPADVLKCALCFTALSWWLLQICFIRRAQGRDKSC